MAADDDPRPDRVPLERPGAREREVALRAVLALPVEDALIVYRALGDALAGQGVEESEAEKQLRLRVDALAAMRAVAAHAQITERAPTLPEFEAGCKQLGLRWDRNGVRRAWGRFRSLQQAYIGGRVVQTAAQKRASRESVGGRRRERERPDYLGGVRLWLATEPESRAQADYDAWVREHNATRAEGAPRLTQYKAIHHALRATWDDIVAVAAGEKPLSDLTDRNLDDLIDVENNPLRLMSSLDVAFALGVTSAALLPKRRSGGLPEPVVEFDRLRYWHYDDIATLLTTGEVVKRKRGELQHLVLHSGQIAEITGISKQYVTQMVVNGAFERIPKPDGRAGNRHYWLAESVRVWLQERETGA
jgi:hypothetical protein